MKTLKTCLLIMCLTAFSWQMQAQSLVEVFSGSSLPTAQGWEELRFDSSIPYGQAAKDLLVAPTELSAVAGAALKLKVNEVNDQYGDPLYSQLGWFLPRVDLSTAVGFTIEFKAKVINAAEGAFNIHGAGSGKGFRLELSNNKLTEHGNVVEPARELSTASATDDFHVYRVAVAPDELIRVWRDGVLLGTLSLQSFTEDNVLYDGGFEKGGTPEEHGWIYMEEGQPGTLTVSNNPEHAHSGSYGLYVDKGYFKNTFIPVKPGAIYDMSAWAKTINYPEGDGNWRDINGWYDPAGDKNVYFIADRNNKNWKYYEQLGTEAGGAMQTFILETPTGDQNVNQMAFDDLLYSERIVASRIPAGAVNLFPNGDFENPYYHYFPEGDPRNDTCMVNPDAYRLSADAYYGGQDDQTGWFDNTIFSAEHNAAPFWHPFWQARVRVQYNMQSGNSEAGKYFARGKYSLRFFNCGGNRVEYGTDFTGGVDQNRGSNTELNSVPIELEAGKKYTFLLSYHMASWSSDGMTIVVKNGSKEIYRRDARGSDTYPNWRDEVIEFTTDATDHALSVQTQALSGSWNGGTPGVVYFDNLFLFQGDPLPTEDGSYIFFGKPTGGKGAEVDIEYIKLDNTGAYAPDGTFIGEANYAKKTAPLSTVWGEELDPNAPILNEYPRPQLKRDNWTNLNGIWNFTRKSKTNFGTYLASDTYRQKILVPFPVESALSGIMDAEYTNQSKTYHYQKEFTIAKPTDGKRVILNFGAVDWEAYVFVNGTQVAHHQGGFDPFSADITDALNASGTQEITVQTYDPTRGGQPAGKQNPSPGGDQYSPVSGIWQTVWTETVDPTYVTGLALTPVDNSAVRVKVEAANADGATATVTILDGATQVASADMAVGAETSIPISSPKLWSPESPFLYNVKVELKKGGGTTDVVTSYVGIRKIEVKKLRDKPYVYLNDQPTFTYATLDHGYFPEGLYTPASYEALRFDLKNLKSLGLNGVRKFEKIEPAIWYYLADSLGLLVWQDIPAAYDQTNIAELNSADARKANFLREAEAMIKSIRNAPSVVAWIGFNDGWGRYDQAHVEKTVKLFRSFNDGRLVAPESGPDTYELGDVVSSHATPPAMHTNAFGERASVCFVTGIYAYAIDGHIWNTGSSSDIKSDADYATSMQAHADAAKALSLNNLAGMAIVQTSDVEKEINGLWTYDRKVYKPGFKTDSILKDNIEFMKSKIIKPVLKTSAQGGEKWKYKSGTNGMVTVPSDWYSNPSLDESDWSEGLSGFGSSMDWFTPNTAWSGDNIEIYIRKIVNIPVLAPGDKLKFSLAYDEDYELYINGVLASTATGWSTSYVSIDIDPAAEAAINYGGDNLIAIHVFQNNGGSAIDLGISTTLVSNPLNYEETPDVPVWKDIATAQDWANIKNDLSGFYRLTADIDLWELTYTPIGDSSNPFKGYIDGQNHTVICPEIKGSDRLGLFGYAVGAHFVNLRFVEGSVEGGADVGLLLGRGQGITVEHVVFDDDGSQYKNEVIGRDHVGMIAGKLETGKLSTIKDVYVVNGIVASTEWQAAGLVGIIGDTRIENSYYTGTVAISRTDRENYDNADAGGLVSRIEGGKNQFIGAMSLASEVLSYSGNEFIVYNDAGVFSIDSTSCFTRDDMILDPLKTPNRTNQFARATDAMKRPLADFKKPDLYQLSGWDFTNVWGTPLGGGFPIFRSLGGEFEPNTAIKTVKPQNDLKVWASYGTVFMTSDQPAAVWIYNLQGSLVDRIDFTGAKSVSLPRGVYIVKSAVNGSVKAVKIIN